MFRRNLYKVNASMIKNHKFLVYTDIVLKKKNKYHTLQLKFSYMLIISNNSYFIISKHT